MSTAACFRCGAAIEDAQRVRVTYRLLRSGRAIGTRVECRKFRCACGRTWSTVRPLTPAPLEARIR